MKEEERLGQIEWFEDLKEAIEAGDTEDAIATIDGAIRILRRDEGEQAGGERGEK